MAEVFHPSLLLTAAVAGVATHIVYFQRCEYTRHMRTLVWLFLGAIAAGPLLLARFGAASITACILTNTALIGTFVTATILSTLFYRLFLNPLNRFPGPYLARLSNFWIAFHVGKDLNHHLKLEALHHQYGSIVRVGANRLSIIHPDVIDAGLKNDSVASKGPSYDHDHPHSNLHGLRDKKVHDKLRNNVWAPAFSDRALREYEPQVRVFVDKVLAQIAKREGQPMNLSMWFVLFSFDVMWALAFGKYYGYIDAGERHEMQNILDNAMAVLGLSLPQWFMRLLRMLPGDSTGHFKFVRYTNSELEDSVRNNFAQKDDAELKLPPGKVISSYLLEHYKKAPNPETNLMFQSDARLIVVAGSDSVATTTTFLFHELAKHPEIVSRIREDIRQILGDRPVEEYTDADGVRSKYLNGVINEALRLYPPSPAGVNRDTPPEGMRVGDVYIPGNVNFNMPGWITGRDESIYVRAHELIPERWYSQPELIKNRGAYAPFARGSWGCIGKNLALMELRSMTANVLLRYDMRMAPGEDGWRLQHKSQDHGMMCLAPFEVVFTPVGANG
ncbi:unnamed protein product [Zymoseptoria tritici ST99CH_1E4]|uniref:Uncharacterized protein n=1 Tax=Zymoseptoria tritici ST99CH_1E4 TaxID=1276532 RepID=A0A2H1GNQ8_ZYMTR|nr:unnamed protein product [Zymoseptoria tritici ST99CH_1E4]